MNELKVTRFSNICSHSPVRKVYSLYFQVKLFFNNNQKYASKVARGDQWMAQIRDGGQSGNASGTKCQNGTIQVETGHTLLLIPPQPPEIWFQHLKNSKTALMKKKKSLSFFKIHTSIIKLHLGWTPSSFWNKSIFPKRNKTIFNYLTFKRVKYLGIKLIKEMQDL